MLDLDNNLNGYAMEQYMHNDFNVYTEFIRNEQKYEMILENFIPKKMFSLRFDGQETPKDFFIKEPYFFIMYEKYLSVFRFESLNKHPSFKIKYKDCGSF